jgi:hypothetical protein
MAKTSGSVRVHTYLIGLLYGSPNPDRQTDSCLSVCLPNPGGDQYCSALLISESHALARTCRARTVDNYLGAAQLLVHALDLHS